jgi:hypothetical protein
MMNDSVDVILDSMLKRAIKSGLKSLSSISEYYLVIEFNDGTKATMWNANRYCAWLSKGNIEKDDKNYQWNNARPSRSTMAKLYDLFQKGGSND